MGKENRQRISIIFFVLAVLLSACTSEPTHKVVNGPVIPLGFKPLALTTALLTPVVSEDINTIVKIVAYQQEKITVHIYTKNNDDYNLYANIKTPTKKLEIDGLIGYGSDTSAITVSQIDFNGIPLIKIEGFIGANAPLTQYIRVENNTPKSFWAIESHVFEVDADGDGVKELIAAAGGTIPDTSIVKSYEGRFFIVNLNEVMNGSVSFDQEHLLFNVYYGGEKQPEQYKLTSNGMEFAGYIKQ